MSRSFISILLAVIAVNVLFSSCRGFETPKNQQHRNIKKQQKKRHMLPSDAYKVQRQKKQRRPQSKKLALSHEQSPKYTQEAPPTPTLILDFVKNERDGSLAAPFLQKLADVFKTDLFIETGTFLGTSALRAAPIFKEVHTIELSKELSNKAKDNLKDQKNTTVYSGDSANVLLSLLPTLKGRGRIFFWLDGHYSGNNHHGHATALNGPTPLLRELYSIKQSGIQDAIILIDDIRYCDISVHNLEDPGIGGYPLLSTIHTEILNINKNYRFAVMGDALLAYPYDPTIKLSPTLQACTISRLYDETNIDPKLILDAEAVIAHAHGQDKQVIELLNSSFGTDAYGIARHYNLWYALILFNSGEYTKSLELLNHIYSRGFSHWRIKFYIAQVASKLSLLEAHSNVKTEMLWTFRQLFA